MKRAIFIGILLLAGCQQVNPKYKDSQAINELSKYKHADISRWDYLNGQWNITLYLENDSTIRGEGDSVGLAYENALKNKRKLCD